MPEIDQTSKCFVFSTDIQDKKALSSISDILDNIEGLSEWSVDLEDWEKVLRVVGLGICPDNILTTLRKQGVNIQKMEVN